MSISVEWLAVVDADADEEERALISASITDEQLHALTGTRDLAGVRFLQMAVDSEFVPLGSLGERLPQLEQLKLNGSSLPSLRLIGSSLTRVRVLWLCRCGLRELDNLWAVPELQELYLAFNDIEQLSPIHEAEQLQVLDLEANLVADSVGEEGLVAREVAGAGHVAAGQVADGGRREQLLLGTREVVTRRHGPVHEEVRVVEELHALLTNTKQLSHDTHSENGPEARESRGDPGGLSFVCAIFTQLL